MNKAVFRLLTAALALSWTPALAQAPSVAPGGTLYGNRTAAQAQPAYTAVPVLGIPGSVLGRLGLAGSTSGTVTITPQAAAGTPTLTLPNASGTFAVSATSPLVLSATTGALTCPTCLANTPAALTKSDDTNVTLTLGGSPSVALLNAASIAAGWTGQLSLARGGTAANLTASNGGLVYSTASALAILSGTATANQIPLSGSSAAPSWSTATYPGTAAAGTILAAGSANVIAGTATPTLGANGGTGGQVTLNGATSGSAVVKVAAAAGTTNFQLPVGNGTNGFVLTTNGSGVTSWTAAGSGTVTSVTCNGGATVITTSGTCASREVLAGNRTYYVRTDGSDSNTCLADSAGGACLTMQGAWNKAQSIDANGNSVTFQVKDGTYTGGLSMISPILGAANVSVTGNTGTPANVNINTTNADGISCDGFSQPINLSGFKITTTSSGSAISVRSCTIYITGAMNFGTSAGDQFHLNGGSVVAFSNYTISGSAVGSHIHIFGWGSFGGDGVTVTLSGTPNFGGYYCGIASGSASFTSATFSGAATGQRYFVHLNGAMKLAGVTLPGNAAGVSDGGNVDDNIFGAAWTAFSPTPTPAGGAMTAIAAGAYQAQGKTVRFRLLIGITNAGTGTGAISFAAPTGTSNGAAAAVAREVSVTGVTGTAFITNASSTFSLSKYDASTMIVTGGNIIVSGEYEIN